MGRPKQQQIPMTPQGDSNQTLTMNQFAARLQLSKRRACELLKAGKIPGAHHQDESVTSPWIIPLAGVEAFEATRPPRGRPQQSRYAAITSGVEAIGAPPYLRITGQISCCEHPHKCDAEAYKCAIALSAAGIPAVAIQIVEPGMIAILPVSLYEKRWERLNLDGHNAK